MQLPPVPSLCSDIVAIAPSRAGAILGIANGGYTLSSDPVAKLVRIAITGFWTAGVMRDFARDLVAEVRKVDGGENRHVILCDLSDAVIQSQETFEAFRSLLERGPTQARKLALITDHLAMRMQAKRLVAVRDAIAIFADAADGLRWLTRADHA